MVPWPSGKAKVCNTSIPGSIPGGTSNNKAQSKRTGLCCWSCYARNEPGFLAPAQENPFAFAAKPSESDSRSEAFSSGKRANFRAKCKIPELWHRRHGHLHGVLFCWSRHSFIKLGLRAPKAQRIRFAYPARSDEVKTIDYCFHRGKPKQGVVQAECIEATDDYATACYRGAPRAARHSPDAGRGYSRQRRDSGIIMIKR